VTETPSSKKCGCEESKLLQKRVEQLEQEVELFKTKNKKRELVVCYKIKMYFLQSVVNEIQIFSYVDM